MRYQAKFASVAAGLILLGVVTTLGLGLPQSFETIQGEEVERFLTEAKFVRLGKTLGGVTQSRQAILELDGVTRFGVFKTIDESRSGYTQLSRGGEINFQDSWRTEIPAYELDKLLRLRMVPVTVERTYNGAGGSLQAWVDLGMSVPVCEGRIRLTHGEAKCKAEPFGPAESLVVYSASLAVLARPESARMCQVRRASPA